MPWCCIHLTLSSLQIYNDLPHSSPFTPPSSLPAPTQTHSPPSSSTSTTACPPHQSTALPSPTRPQTPVSSLPRVDRGHRCPRPRTGFCALTGSGPELPRGSRPWSRCVGVRVEMGMKGVNGGKIGARCRSGESVEGMSVWWVERGVEQVNAES